MDILVIQTAYLGDLFLSIPLMREIKKLRPDQRLVLVCRGGLGSVFLDMGLADEVIEVHKKDQRRWKEERLSLLQREFSDVICPHESMRTALWVRQIRAQGKKIGFHKWWNRFAFTHRVAKPMFLPDALRQLSLLAALDDSFAEQFSQLAVDEKIHNPSRRDGALDFSTVAIPEWARMQLSALSVETVKGEAPLIWLAPGSQWATKRWLPESYAEVAKTLLGRGYRVALMGSPSEVELNAKVAALAPGVDDFTGRWSLEETLRQLSRGALLIANDSGAIHMAAAAGLPTVAIFGPTTLDLGFRPWQEQAVVVQKDLPCRPCGRHGHQECPIKTHDCMKKVSAAEVVAAAATLLRRQGRVP